MKHEKIKPIFLAMAAALFYAMETVPSIMMAGFLYLGAGTGIGFFFLLTLPKAKKTALLSTIDLPYTLGMIALDILAPILLMCGLRSTTSANASLLNNFEIVATTVVAFVIFKETVSKEMWAAIALITLSSMILSCEDFSGLQFSWGSLLVLAAAVCWGFENNCTRKISAKNTYEIVTIKGICSGLGSLIIGLACGEKAPSIRYVFMIMLLGFVAYGLSILFYIKAQKDLGAAKTSAYYAIAPFIGAFLSFAVLKEPLSAQYFIALVVMAAGTSVVTIDTLRVRHQ